MTEFKFEEVKWEKETVVGLDLEEMAKQYQAIANMKTDETEYWTSVEFKEGEK